MSSGFYTMVMTDFGLRVKFDGNHRVEVTLPSTFGQKVCGMCGNYNGIAADDFQNPEGEMETDSTSLGNSWEVSNNSRWVRSPSSHPDTLGKGRRRRHWEKSTNDPGALLPVFPQLLSRTSAHPSL